jgi:carboxyl-terminal processing protease
VKLYRHLLRHPALLILLVLLGGMPGCVIVGVAPPSDTAVLAPEARAEVQSRVFDQVWDRVNRRFYARDFNGADWAAARATYRDRAIAAPNTEKFYGVINEMLAELGDAHTAALSPQEAWHKYTAARAMVGLYLERVDDQWVVSEVRPGSAAERAGVRPGWVALSRDGEPLPDQGISFLNTPGEIYHWAFLDYDDQRQVLPLLAEMTADWRPPVERVSDQGWVYLRFDEFEGDYQRWLRERLRVHQDAPGIVLDLRYNGGGAVLSLERIINDFFPRRVDYGMFVTRKGRERPERSAWFRGAAYRGPVAVLIGEGSASSSEILAYLLQHYQRATLIGRQTPGVVIASQHFGLADGGELQLGVFDYRAVDGSRLEGNGVKPDIHVPRTLRAMRQGEDADLEAAVAWLEQQRSQRARSELAAGAAGATGH